MIEERIKDNEKLVHLMINKMFYHTNNAERIAKNRSMDMQDIIQVGMIGLWKAAESFDESKGYEFSTYATRVIKNEIMHQVVRKYNIKGFDSNVSLKERVKIGVAYDIDEISPNKYEKSYHMNDAIKSIKETKEYKTLTVKERKVFDLRMKEYTYLEIGQMLGTSRQNCQKITRRVRNKLMPLRDNISVI